MPTDPWLVVSSAGFIVSLAFWFVLLKKFRQAGHAMEPAFEGVGSLDRIEPIPVKSESPSASSTLGSIKETGSDATLKISAVSEPTIKITPVREPESPAPQLSPASASSPMAPLPTASTVPAPAPDPAPEPAPKPALPTNPAAVPNLRSGQTLTGGISPAVVYLQNLKEQLEGLRKEVQSVKMQVSGVSQKSESQMSEVLRRLDEIKAVQHAVATGQPLPAPAPAAATSPPTQHAPAQFTLEVPGESKPGAQAEPEPAPAPMPETQKGPVWPT